MDTLECTARSGFDAVPDPRHRTMVASVVDSGLVDEMIALTESFDPPVDLAGARAHADVLTTEFALYGVTVPATTCNITLMRALMVPIADDALALALDRIWVFTTNTDDACCHDPAEAETILRAGALSEQGALSPNTQYIRHMPSLPPARRLPRADPDRHLIRRPPLWRRHRGTMSI
ncbi:hypothetical protein O3Q52_15635 [Streptomyces sp. ActVer]|uniref:hypothetical protein n=1 Tax=Streptomyces sp. ActVer TaxID=3014558 RepID=UPI0022B40581|nr:hypothetical protein [Streptomyces sp. ActVer]MCZ4509601.1 hypothetical protein [Streptomyces sp. ActVer]